jgi:hypothetical protein
LAQKEFPRVEMSNGERRMMWGLLAGYSAVASAAFVSLMLALGGS